MIVQPAAPPALSLLRRFEPQLRRIARPFGVVAGAIALTAAVAALGGGRPVWHSLYTVLLVVATAVAVVINAAAARKDRLDRLPYLGLFLTCGSVTLVIAGLWVDDYSFANSPLSTTMLIALTFGIGITFISAASTAEVHDDWELARQAAYAAGTVGSLIVAISVLADSQPHPIVFVAVGLLVLATGFAVVLGVDVASRRTEAEVLIDLTTPAPNVELYGRVAYCPVCGASIAAEPQWGSTHECGRCHTGFRIEVTQRRSVF